MNNQTQAQPNNTMDLNRLDHILIHALEQDTNPLLTRQIALSKRTEDLAFKKLALSQQPGLERVTDKEDETSFRHLVDYYFEPYFVESMNPSHLNAYLCSIEDRISLTFGELPGGEQPLFIESLHHYCSFSIHYLVILHLAEKRGYDHVILMHRQEQLDPRLTAMQRALSELQDIDSDLIHFGDQWFQEVEANLTDKSIIFYMGDMAPALFPQHHRPGVTGSTLSFSMNDHQQKLSLEGFSHGRQLAKSLNAQHFILDYPSETEAALNPFSVNSNKTELRCPLAAWIFWPALSLFKDVHVQENKNDQ